MRDVREDENKRSHYGHVGLRYSDNQLRSQADRSVSPAYDLFHSHLLAADFALALEILVAGEFA